MTWDEHRPYRVPGPLIPEGVVVLAIAAVATALLLGGAFLLRQWLESQSCVEIQAQTGTPTRYTYGLGGQCFVQVGGRWIPAGAWRQVAP